MLCGFGLLPILTADIINFAMHLILGTVLSVAVPLLLQSDCIGYCLDSLRKQTYRNFEVVISDQSDCLETGG